SVTVSGTRLDAPGETAVVNSTGHLHNHPVWQLTGAGGAAEPEPKTVSFRLHGAGFASSSEITVRLEVFDGQAPGEPH
ncbi:MAG TPA: hypothetical protein VEB21_15010, partial [Terriglobales bacterium]|nr:hypothetical protein [Terriglobales bacterium]